MQLELPNEVQITVPIEALNNSTLYGLNIVVQDTSYHAIIDSGASITVGSLELKNSLSKLRDIKMIPLTTTQNVAAANGQKLNPKGTFQLNFSVEGSYFSQTVTIMENLHMPLLLGQDFLKKHRAI